MLIMFLNIYTMTDNFSFDLYQDVFRILPKMWRYFKYHLDIKHQISNSLNLNVGGVMQINQDHVNFNFNGNISNNGK